MEATGLGGGDDTAGLGGIGEETGLLRGGEETGLVGGGEEAGDEEDRGDWEGGGLGKEGDASGEGNEG